MARDISKSGVTVVRFGISYSIMCDRHRMYDYGHLLILR